MHLLPERGALLSIGVSELGSSAPDPGLTGPAFSGAHGIFRITTCPPAYHGHASGADRAESFNVADIINLNRARKQKKRKDAVAQAAENRIRHGRTKAQKQLERTVSELEQNRLDQHRLSSSTTPTGAEKEDDHSSAD